jgi:hypothetical protein
LVPIIIECRFQKIYIVKRQKLFVFRWTWASHIILVRQPIRPRRPGTSNSHRTSRLPRLKRPNICI